MSGPEFSFAEAQREPVGTCFFCSIDSRALASRNMTMLVASLGLLPAAMSQAIGSDSQRPFAIVIVGGLMSALVLSVFVLPTLYAWIARPSDKLPEPEVDLEESV